MHWSFKFGILIVSVNCDNSEDSDAVTTHRTIPSPTPRHKEEDAALKKAHCLKERWKS